MRIKAAVCPCAKHAFQIEDVEMRDPLPDEIRVKIVATGICRTDSVARDQTIPFPLPGVLGHEGAGVVDFVGARVKKNIAKGDHVVLSVASCGVCVNCATGHSAYCLYTNELNFSGVQTPGTDQILHDAKGVVHSNFFGQSSFASYALVKERNVVVIPKDVPLELMGPLGCGIGTGAGTVMHVLQPHAGGSIAIFGAGGVGLAGVMAAKAVGCGVIICCDRHDNRLALAKELGATHIIDTRQTDAVAAIAKIMKPYSPAGAPDEAIGVDYALDSTGVPAVTFQATQALAYRGCCAFVGSAGATTQITVSAEHMLAGRVLRGAIQGDNTPDIFIPQLIELWRKGVFPFDKLVKFYNFDQINQAFADSDTGIAIKPVLRQAM